MWGQAVATLLTYVEKWIGLKSLENFHKEASFNFSLDTSGEYDLEWAHRNIDITLAEIAVRTTKDANANVVFLKKVEHVDR